MNKKQKVIVSLLKEIDEICRQNNIMYYLSPRLTLCAVTEQPFPQNPLFGVVMMKVEDMERFRRLIEEDPREKRALESMKSHKWFPGFSDMKIQIPYVSIWTEPEIMNIRVLVSISFR